MKLVKYIWSVFLAMVVAYIVYEALFRSGLPVDNNALFIGSCILAAVQNRL